MDTISTWGGLTIEILAYNTEMYAARMNGVDVDLWFCDLPSGKYPAAVGDFRWTVLQEDLYLYDITMPMFADGMVQVGDVHKYHENYNLTYDWHRADLMPREIAEAVADELGVSFYAEGLD